jgi:hypothetical protein
MQGQVDGVMDSITGAGHSVAGRNIVKREILSTVTAAISKQKTNAAFLTMCDEHCGQWGTGQNVSALHPAAVPDFNVSISGIAGYQAVAVWWSNLVAKKEFGHLWVQTADYPCRTCCFGGSK